MRILNKVAGSAAVAALLFASSPALAHVKVVSSTPAAEAAVAAPRSITVTFNERVVPTFSRIEVAMVGHDMSVPVRTTVSRDGKTITATPQGQFMKGRYTINWVAASADGHRMSGEIPFQVR